MQVSQLLSVMRRLHSCGPWISTVVCSTFVPRLRSWIGVVLVADSTTHDHLELELGHPVCVTECFPRGDVCSFSNLAHQKGEARAARNPSYPWRVRDSIASWFLSVLGNRTR